MTASSSAEATKACCADLYASDWARLLLGDSLHPGGLALTERLGVLLGLDAQTRVLDLAAGRGTSALHLARMFGCQVTGVDYGARNVALACDAAREQGLADQVQFMQADAEQLSAIADESFDAVVCECAYCTFPNKHAAATEIGRVLAPGGRFGLSDLKRNGDLPPELEGVVAWIACVADAQPVASYVADLEAVGLRVSYIEAHDEALTELIDQVRRRLVAAGVVAKIRQVELPGVDLQVARQVARSAAEAVHGGSLGYTLITAVREARTGGHQESASNR
jgi:ubiquinone/menaquinone biosynthesis C-methylase UbiE